MQEGLKEVGGPIALLAQGHKKGIIKERKEIISKQSHGTFI